MNTIKTTNADYPQKSMLTNHAKLGRRRGRADSCDHFLLGSDSLGDHTQIPPCSQDGHQMPLQKDVEEAGERVRTFIPGDSTHPLTFPERKSQLPGAFQPSPFRCRGSLVPFWVPLPLSLCSSADSGPFLVSLALV